MVEHDVDQVARRRPADVRLEAAELDHHQLGPLERLGRSAQGRQLAALEVQLQEVRHEAEVVADAVERPHLDVDGHLRLAGHVLEQRRATVRPGIPPDVELRRPGGIAESDVDDDRCRSDGRDRRRDDLPRVRVRLDHHDLCTGEDRGDVPRPVAAERTAVEDDLGREPEVPRVPEPVVPGRQDAFRPQPLSLADDVQSDGTERPPPGALEGRAGPAAHRRPLMPGAPRRAPSGRSSRDRTGPASGR